MLQKIKTLFLLLLGLNQDHSQGRQAHSQSAASVRRPLLAAAAASSKGSVLSGEPALVTSPTVEEPASATPSGPGLVTSLSTANQAALMSGRGGPGRVTSWIAAAAVGPASWISWWTVGQEIGPRLPGPQTMAAGWPRNGPGRILWKAPGPASNLLKKRILSLLWDDHVRRQPSFYIISCEKRRKNYLRKRPSNCYFCYCDNNNSLGILTRAGEFWCPDSWRVSCLPCLASVQYVDSQCHLELIDAIRPPPLSPPSIWLSWPSSSHGRIRQPQIQLEYHLLSRLPSRHPDPVLHWFRRQACSPTPHQRWKSQRIKIHWLAYRFSTDFQIHTLAYGFVLKITKILQKSRDFLFADF